MSDDYEFGEAAEMAADAMEELRADRDRLAAEVERLRPLVDAAHNYAKAQKAWHDAAGGNPIPGAVPFETQHALFAAALALEAR